MPARNNAVSVLNYYNHNTKQDAYLKDAKPKDSIFFSKDTNKIMKTCGYFTLGAICVVVAATVFTLLGVFLSKNNLKVINRIYSESCASDPCAIDLNLYCNPSTKLCDCVKSKYWNGEKCDTKKEYNESCTTMVLCNDAKNFVCLNKICQCNPNTTYYDPITKICENKVLDFQPCYATFQCYGNMICSTKGLCECGPIQYYDRDLLTCKDQTLGNTYCKANYTCRVDKDLACINNLCMCDPVSKFWMSSIGSCHDYLQYSENQCRATSECVGNQNLVCNLNAVTNKCDCPTTSANTMCDCPRNLTMQTFWDGTYCTNAYNVDSACSVKYQCMDPMDCVAQKCSCPQYKYFDAAKLACFNQTMDNTDCAANYTCRGDLGLYCQSGICQCDTRTQFWMSLIGACHDYLNYSESTCVKDSNCKSTLICNLNAGSNKCDCPTASVNGMCDCSHSGANQTYWDGSKCVLAISEYYPCTADYQCFGDMTCKSNKCQCGINQYFNTTLLLCLNQTMNNTVCSQNYTCRIDLGLSCVNNLCQCDVKTQFWMTSINKCHNYLSYAEGTCNADSQCKYNLFCNLNAIVNPCNCPNTSVSGVCDCRNSGFNQQYWNNTYCISRNYENGVCNSTYQCLGDMTCIGNRCKCGSYQYFNTTVLLCLNQTMNNTVCSQSYSCRIDLGLSCVNNLCQCNVNTQFWMSTIARCNNYLTYAEGTCNADSQCKYSLFCNLSPTTNACNCPNNSVSGVCDCRNSGFNQQYWNNTNCISRHYENQACNSTYQCLGDMTCSVLTNKCQCGNYQYFNTTLLLCLNQTMNNTVCSVNYTCRGDLGLSCINGLCQCDSSYQFWMSTIGRCNNYLTYAEGTCNADSQCKYNLFCNLNAIVNPCNCPNTSVSGFCDCRNSGFNQQYWNNTYCVSRHYENDVCNSTYQCIGNMTCGVTKKCTCGSFYYFNTTINACLNKTLINTVCSVNYTCRGDLGLSCISGLCQCDSRTQFWMASATKCNNYLNYADTGCVADSNCKSTLICNTNAASNPCNCPTMSVSGMCDCPRVANNETYWDAALGACMPAKDYMQSCNVSRNYTCKTVSNNLQCTSSGVCDCGGINPGMSINNVCKDCGASAYYYQKKCFYISTNISNWNDAKMFCIGTGLNGRLVVLTNDTINTFVYSKLITSTNYWVGVSGTPWTWLSGAAVASTAWCSGSPGASGSCAALQVTTTQCLVSNSNTCGSSSGNLKCICEFDLQ